MTSLTSAQAYMAMFAFLEAQYQSTGSDDLGALLGSLSLLQDGLPADSAHRAEWDAAVQVAIDGKVDIAFGGRPKP